MIYINPYLSIPINTIIGGVAGSIPNKSALATKLAISESIIKRFEIVGSDVKASISSGYHIPASTFENDLTITSYLDLEGKCFLLEPNINVFKNATNLLDVVLPATTLLPAFCLNNCPLNVRFSAPMLNRINESSLSFTNFPNQLPSTISILGPSALYSINAGTVLDLPLVTILSVNPTPIRDSATLQEIYLDNCTEITARSSAFRNLTALNILSLKKLKIFSDASATTPFNCFAGLKLGCEIRTNITMATASGGNAHFLFAWAKANRGAIVKFYDDAGNYISTL